MSLGILQFQPQLLPTVLAVVLIPLFVVLGFWQLDRAADKRQLAETLSGRSAAPAVELTASMQRFDEIEFRQVAASGRMLGAQTIFIENRKHLGRNGFHVISPLRLGGGDRHLLVNRGWVATADRRSPPDVATPETPVTVTGRATVPAAPALELQLQLDAGQRVWPYLTVARYAAWSGLELLPFVLLQTDDDGSGFVRQWPQPATQDGMHIGYAIQWFAFALIVFVIWMKLSLVHRRAGADA